jgi:putative glutamine amidotransferase
MTPDRPLVGISMGQGEMPITEGILPSHYVGQGYVRAVSRAGGWPIAIPSVEGEEEATAAQAAAHVAAIVLSGGNDIAPETFGAVDGEADKPDPSRDRFEIALVRLARERGIPVLGICRGMELINVAYGGTLRSGVRHEQAEHAGLPGLRDARLHQIRLEKGSRAWSALGRDEVEAICLHHQAPDTIGNGLRVTGTAADGTAEVVEDSDAWVVGVLWHPEQALDRTPVQQRLYESLVQAARRHA